MGWTRDVFLFRSFFFSFFDMQHVFLLNHGLGLRPIILLNRQRFMTHNISLFSSKMSFPYKIYIYSTWGLEENNLTTRQLKSLGKIMRLTHASY